MNPKNASKVTARDEGTKTRDKTDETTPSQEERDIDNDMKLRSEEKARLLEEARSKCENKWMLWIM